MKTMYISINPPEHRNMCSLDARSPCVCIQILRSRGHKSQLLATYWDNFAFNPSLHEYTTANDIWQFRIGILKNPAVDLTLQYQGLHTFVHGTDMYASTVVHKGTAYWGVLHGSTAPLPDPQSPRSPLDQSCHRQHPHDLTCTRAVQG